MAGGSIYLGNGIYQTILSFDGFATMHNLREFLAPLFLSVLFLPYLYAISIIMTYETVGVATRFLIKDESLHSYAMRQALLHFRFDLDCLQRWRRNIGIFHPESKEQILEIISEVKSLKRRERQSEFVPYDLGWSPYASTKFLAKNGLETDDYHRSYDDQWWASSRVLQVENESLFHGSIVYYVSGDEKAVKRLKLTLNVTDGSGGVTSDERFSAICEVLLKHAIGEVPIDLLGHAMNGEQIDKVIGGRRVRLTRDDHVHTKMHGYLRTLIIDTALVTGAHTRLRTDCVNSWIRPSFVLFDLCAPRAQDVFCTTSRTILPKGACRPLLDTPCGWCNPALSRAAPRQRLAVASPVRAFVPRHPDQAHRAWIATGRAFRAPRNPIGQRAFRAPLETLDQPLCGLDARCTHRRLGLCVRQRKPLRSWAKGFRSKAAPDGV